MCAAAPPPEALRGSRALQKLPEKQALAGGSASITPAVAQALGATEADFVRTLSAGGQPGAT